MNTFQRIGEAQLLAAEGQRVMAETMIAFLKTGFQRFVRLVARQSSGSLHS